MASGGRLFKAFGNVAFKRREEPWLNQLVAFNGYNGTILWTRSLTPGYMIHRNTLIATPDTVYVADYQLRKGIVIAKTDDFNARGFIGEAQAEGVAVDAAGNVYAGEVTSRNLKKFVRTR